MQNEDNFQYLKSRINQEGFHYCFVHYSNFEEIEDEQFHQLRKIYLESVEKLTSYINKRTLLESMELYDE